ncbi:mucin-19-like [Macrobrachium nipponense]|uniref:mucin-19-like n=1 Tax=Macrobrachium nipponense TaxID=159736 RepID=UPI0030C7F383
MAEKGCYKRRGMTAALISTSTRAGPAVSSCLSHLLTGSSLCIKNYTAMTTLRPHRVLFIAIGLIAWTCFAVRAQEEEAVFNALTAVDIIRLGDPDDDMIVGEAGSNYPTYAEVPNTSFSCEQQGFPGYYADQDTQCQVFHICVTQGRRLEKFSFLCPNGTIFNQQYLVCVWWYDFDCGQASSLYSINADIFGDTPSTLPSNFLDDVTGTAAASAPRGRPTTARFPVTGSGPQGDLSDGGILPFSPREGVTGSRGGLPTIASDPDTRVGLPTVTGDQGSRRGLTTPPGGQGTRGGLPSSPGEQGTRGALPTSVAGQGTKVEPLSAAIGQGIGGGLPSSVAIQDARGELPSSGTSQSTRGGTSENLPSKVSGTQNLGGFPSTLGIQSRPGTSGSTLDSTRRPGISRDKTGATGIEAGAQTISQLPADVSNRGGLSSGFVEESSITPGFGISQPGTSGTPTASRIRPTTAGVSSGGITSTDEGQLVDLGSQTSEAGITGSGGGPGITEGFTSPALGTSAAGGFTGLPSRSGSTSQISEAGITGSGGRPGITDGFTSPALGTTAAGGFTDLPSRSGPTRGSSAVLGRPGTSENFIDTDSEFPPLTSDNLGFVDSGITPAGPGGFTTFTDGLGSTRLSDQISESGATSEVVGLPGRPSTADLIGPSGKPELTGFVSSLASPTAVGGKPGTAGIGSDSSNKPSTTGGFISSLGTPGITGGLTSSLDDPSSTGGYTSSVDRPGTTGGITDSSDLPALVGDRILPSDNAPGTTAGFLGSAGTPGVDLGTAGVVFDPAGGQGISDFTSLVTRPEITDALTSPVSDPLSQSISTSFPTETLISAGIPDGTLLPLSVKPTITPGQTFSEVDFGTSPSVSDSFSGDTESIISQLDTAGRITVPGIGDAQTTSFSVSGSQGTSPVSPPLGGLFETFPSLTEDPARGTLGIQVDPESINRETSTGQYDQSQDAISQDTFQDQGLLTTQQGLTRPQLFQGQEESILKQTDPAQVSSAGLDQDSFSITQGILSQDQSHNEQLLGKDPTPGLADLTGIVSGQVNEDQSQTLGFVQGQGQADPSTERQSNQGYSYPVPSDSLTPGLGINTATGSQSTSHGNVILITGDQGISFSVQHQTQGSERNGFRGIGNIDDNSNVLISQGTFANQPFQNNAEYQTSQVTENTFLNNDDNNNNFDSTTFVIDNLSSAVNQNQPASNFVNIVSEGGQSLQGYNYNDPSVDNVHLLNSISIDEGQTLGQPGSQSLSKISDTLSINVASGVGSVDSPTSLTQQYSPPSIDFSTSGLGLHGSELGSIVQKPLDGISVNNLPSTSPVSLTDSLKQEVVAPVSHAKPTFSFGSPQDSVSAIDLAALQRGYLPPANEISQSSFVPSTGLSLPSSLPLSSTTLLNLPSALPFESSDSTSFGSPGSQGSSLAASSQGPSSTSTFSQGSHSSSSSGLTFLSNANQFSSVGTSSFSFPSASQPSSAPAVFSFSSTSTGSSSSPALSSGSQVSSTGSQTFSSFLPTSSQGNNINIGEVSSPLSLGYLPPVGDSRRNIRQTEEGHSKIYVTPIPNKDQGQVVSEQRSNGGRAFRPSLLFKHGDTSDFQPKSSSNRFGRIFFPSGRRTDGFPITYVDNTRRSFVASSSSPFNPYNKYSLTWKS